MADIVFCDMDWFWGNLGAKLVIEHTYWKIAKMSQKLILLKIRLDMNFYAYLRPFHKFSRFPTTTLCSSKHILRTGQSHSRFFADVSTFSAIFHEISQNYVTWRHHVRFLTKVQKSHEISVITFFFWMKNWPSACANFYFCNIFSIGFFYPP